MTAWAAQSSKAQTAYERIRAQIVNGAYGPGYRLVLDRLATEIGVSAVPIREALRRLQAEGLVDFERNLGATVSRVDANTFVQTMQTLAILEASAMAMAAPHVTERDLGIARGLNEAMAEVLEKPDPVRFAGLNDELHQTLYRRCPNTYLHTMVERESTRLRGIRPPGFGFVPSRGRRAVAEHGRLIELIETGASPSKIEDYARAHRMRTARRFAERHLLDFDAVTGAR